ncbi:MAG: cbb3-type cytochrome c oxidase subunit 3 [Pseudomonadota bacterium]
MDTYSFLRQLADSWFLLLMTGFFVAVVLITLRPGARATHDDISRIPFRHEHAPDEGEV